MGTATTREVECICGRMVQSAVYAGDPSGRVGEVMVLEMWPVVGGPFTVDESGVAHLRSFSDLAGEFGTQSMIFGGGVERHACLGRRRRDIDG